jgi:hypothetical protein
MHAYVHQKKNKRSITRISSEKHISPPTATKKEKRKTMMGCLMGWPWSSVALPGLSFLFGVTFLFLGPAHGS